MNSTVATMAVIAVLAATEIYDAFAESTDAGTAGPTVVDLPRGVIVMWSGSLAEIPEGWSLCDGTNGTPDLRDRFVMGVGAREYLGSTGGSYTHSHSTDGHTHRVAPPSTHIEVTHLPYESRGRILRSHRYFAAGRAIDSGVASSRVANTQHLPPYYRIAFIMKSR